MRARQPLLAAAAIIAVIPLVASCNRNAGTAAESGDSIAKGTTAGPIYIPPKARNISGVWWIKSYSPKIQLVNGGDLPFTDEGRKRYAANQAGLKDGSINDDARRICLPDGVPRILGNPYPFEILQSPGTVTIDYELNHVMRPIALDVALPPDDELELLSFFSGHSVGQWQGDTLVVQSGGFNEKTYLDATGTPHSDAMHTEERIRRLDDKTLEITVTVTDPALYTQPWNARYVYDLHPEIRIEDYVCGEQHRDISHIPGVKPAT